MHIFNDFYLVCLMKTVKARDRIDGTLFHLYCRHHHLFPDVIASHGKPLLKA